jgi:CHAT domain-containing protein/tetratricopeptide (TPR) repeat protein
MSSRCGWLCVLVLGLGAVVVRGAGPPRPLTAQQKSKLAERDRLEKQLPDLLRKRQFDKALESMERIATLGREALGEAHPVAIDALEKLAGWREELEQYPAALRVRQEVLRLREKRLGKGHWQATDARLDLEYTKRLGGLGDEQRAQLRQADTWDGQVLQLCGQGRAREAVALARKALELRRKLLGEKHTRYADSLNNLAGCYESTGEYGKALPLYQEAVEVRRKLLGERHPDYATSLNNLAVLYHGMGEDGKALPLFREVRALLRRALGESHPLYAASVNNLAANYHALGEHSQALLLYLEALQLCRKAAGERHPDYALSLNNLGDLYREMGEDEKALPFLLEALELRRKILGEKHPDYALSLNNLGMLYLERREHRKALPLLLETRALSRKLLGEKHPLYAASLGNLALLYHSMGEYGKSLPMTLEALELRRKILGEKHPHYATSLDRLALLYQSMGEPRTALPLFLEVRRLRREVLGERHPDYAQSVTNLGVMYWEMGKLPEALEAFSAALNAFESYLDDGFEHLGEQQRTWFLKSVLHNLSFLLAIQQRRGVPAGKRYSAVLRWKGRVASTDRFDRLLRDRPELKESLERLQAVRGRLVRLSLQTPEAKQHAIWLKQIQDLADEKVRLEGDLARRSAGLRRLQQRQRLTPELLSKEVPEGAAFIDLLRYVHYSPPKGGDGKVEAHLLAFVVVRGKEPVAVALGPVKPLADAVARWRAEVEKPPTSANRQVINRSAQTLRQRLWAPLRKHLGGAKTVIVAPDGVLCEFPLAALPGDKPGTYLIEEIAITQVASAQQLVDLCRPSPKPAKPARGLVALGGVDYGSGKTDEPLPGTKAEVRRCRALFLAACADEPASRLTGKEAGVAAVKQVLAEKKPRYLHLATHGFFEPAERVERLMRGLGARRDALSLWWAQTTTLQSLPNLRCGLALAGANQLPPKDDPTALPGILTGDDLEGLDLRGCELAVLSACQTALGDVKSSQGVFGLQRSFHAAGVRTTVSSLWSVHDAATLVLMEEFCSRLWGKQKVSRLEALRQAQLTVLRHPERVRKRAEELLADAKKRGLSEAMLRGVKGRLATDLPDGGKVEKPPTRSPEAWWAAFVLCGDWR